MLITFRAKSYICDHLNETSLPVLSNGAICFQNFTNEIWEFLLNFALSHTWH